MANGCRDGVVASCSRTGGVRGWQLYGISRWNSVDGKRLKKHLEMEYRQNHKTPYLLG